MINPLSVSVSVSVSALSLSKVTFAFQVGMQNSVMALALASKHFPSLSTQIPCAVSAVSMNVMGAGLAVIFSYLNRVEEL
jgi:predicted Na+-dependent transporter